jgi:hypothetical protein
MPNSVYTINKGINKPISFKGLKAQYIWYLGGGLLVLLVLFAVLYICGVNTYLLLFLTICLGTVLFLFVYRLSHQYGEHGLRKKMARRSIPRKLRVNSRRLFLQQTT